MIQIFIPFRPLALLVSEQCLRGVVINWPLKVYET